MQTQAEGCGGASQGAKGQHRVIQIVKLQEILNKPKKFGPFQRILKGIVVNFEVRLLSKISSKVLFVVIFLQYGYKNEDLSFKVKGCLTSLYF